MLPFRGTIRDRRRVLKAADEGNRVIRYVCDKCGLRMAANDPRRFIVKFEVYAAAGPVDLDPLASSDAAGQWDQIMDDLAEADPDEVEDQTYRCLRFDVCDACRQGLLKRPLG